MGTSLLHASFEIHIASSDARGTYRVYTKSSAGRSAKGILRLERGDFYTLEELKRSGASANEWNAHGEHLFERLLKDDIESEYRFALGSVPGYGRLRVLLRTDPSDLDRVPWELLRDPYRHRTLAIDMGHSVARTPAFAEPRIPLSRGRSLGILGIFPESSELDTSAEIAALKALNHERSNLQVKILNQQVTRAAIRADLREFKPTAVHFGGHGQHDDAGAFVWLDREDGLPDRIEADAFAELLTREPGLGVVVLASCEGGRRADSGRGRGLAGELLVLGVPGVVAMHTAILNSRASDFVEELYSDLADSPNGDLEAAVGSARRRLREDRPRDPSFASPILFLRSESFELWSEDEAGGTASTEDSMRYAVVEISLEDDDPAEREYKYLMSDITFEHDPYEYVLFTVPLGREYVQTGYTAEGDVSVALLAVKGAERYPVTVYGRSEGGSFYARKGRVFKENTSLVLQSLTGPGEYRITLKGYVRSAVAK